MRRLTNLAKPMIFIDILKVLLNLGKNIIAMVLVIVLIFKGVGIFSSIPEIDADLDGNKITVGVEDARPVYELTGEDIEGTVNAFGAIEGKVAPGSVIDLYSKDKIDAVPLWDENDPDAIGKAEYVGFGFLGFNYITNLQENDILVFPKVNFGDVSPEYISMQISKTMSTGGVISFYIDELSEKSLIAIFDVTGVSMGGGEYDFFQIIEKIGRGKQLTGVHKLYMVVEQSGVNAGNIRFGK